MVIDQGTILDRIDYNIENMAVHVKAAEEELVQVCFVPSGTATVPNNCVNMGLRHRKPKEPPQKGKSYYFYS